MILSEYAVTAILEELKKRTAEAEENYKMDKQNEFNQGYYEAYFEVLEIINNRKDW